mmetsp:Transcript_41551/g.120353  ORF Transcript_41551/g.120353 Transcript_41551/m.120353 type:complete len:600 (+) Transcript_41551:69-1868(+)
MSMSSPQGSQRSLIVDHTAAEMSAMLAGDIEQPVTSLPLVCRPALSWKLKGAALFSAALLSTGFGVAVFQLRAHGLTGARVASRIVEADGPRNGCRTITRDDPCWGEIDWAMTTGIRMFPQEYRGLTAMSSVENFQAQLHKMGIARCPMPCNFAGADSEYSPAAEEEMPDWTADAAHGKHNGEACRDVGENDECYSAVIDALSVGVIQHPELYSGMLSQFSGFRDAQYALYQLGIGKCPRPCGDEFSDDALGGAGYDVGGAGAWSSGADDADEVDGASDVGDAWGGDDGFVEVPQQGSNPGGCRDATYERDNGCYKSVMWAQALGIYQHREWYPGLSPDSSFGAFQADLHKKKVGNCTKPCNTDSQPKVKPEGVSLFCFSFFVQGSNEEQLVRFMLEKENGIFACDDFRVVSTAKIDLGRLRGKRVVSIFNAEAATKKRDSWHNSELFVTTWSFLMKEVRSMFKQDWIVKIDPDCVFFPDRLKVHIQQHAVAGSRQYFTNCNQGGSKLYGALEVFSREAILVYEAVGEHCRYNQYWNNLGEDLYFEMCMSQLHVTKVGDFTLVGDQRCSEAWCGDHSRASFHPYKDIHSFSTCFAQATR